MPADSQELAVEMYLSLGFLFQTTYSGGSSTETFRAHMPVRCWSCLKADLLSEHGCKCTRTSLEWLHRGPDSDLGDPVLFWWAFMSVWGVEA